MVRCLHKSWNQYASNSPNPGALFLYERSNLCMDKEMKLPEVENDNSCKAIVVDHINRNYSAFYAQSNFYRMIIDRYVSSETAVGMNGVSELVDIITDLTKVLTIIGMTLEADVNPAVLGYINQHITDNITLNNIDLFGFKKKEMEKNKQNGNENYGVFI